MLGLLSRRNVGRDKLKVDWGERPIIYYLEAPTARPKRLCEFSPPGGWAIQPEVLKEVLPEVDPSSILAEFRSSW